jgi:hypothetical protein
LSIGVLDKWNIGMKREDYDISLFLYLASLHHSTIPLFQKGPELAGITNPFWGLIRLTSGGLIKAKCIESGFFAL